MFLPPHLRLQTAAYLPQEGGALIFKQGAKRRTKRFCPSSSLSPRVKKAERDKLRKLHTHSKFIRNAPKYLCGQTNKQIP